MCRNYRVFVSVVLTVILAFQLTASSLAAAPFVDITPATASADYPDALSAYGLPLSEQEMEATEGEWGHIGWAALGAAPAGAAAGAIENWTENW